ncbi:flagellar hook-length control protein FliK [Clostridium aestuarii]|uniref:Flagellar hook-length control protein FliK n=1 Tax=Clostridium aestuarii TaxID=338193 RepID=A0ABT4D0I3_9CLOT|nr:flagellar hook-length control protein FliK [Clostridium aestuarii]MCY6483685.1 flagellar hook-length control protein FliK [Clostridium aestuarii]
MNGAVINAVKNIKTASTRTNTKTLKNDSTQKKSEFGEVFSNIANKEIKSQQIKDENLKTELQNNDDKTVKDNNQSLSKTELKKSEINDDKAEDLTDSEKVDEKLLTLLQKFLNGKITLNELLLKADENSYTSEEFIDALSDDISKLVFTDMPEKGDLKNDIAEVLKKNFSDILGEKSALNDTDANKLMLYKLLQNADKDISSNLKNEIIEAVKKNLDSMKLNNNMDSKVEEQILKEIKSKLFELEDGQPSNMEESFKMDIAQLRRAKINQNTNVVQQEIKSQNAVGSLQNSESDDLFNQNNNDDSKLLKELLSDNKNDGSSKINKAVNFMTQFNKINQSDSVSFRPQNMVVNRSNFINDVIKNVKYIELNNMKEMTVKVMPEGLGELTIKLTMESGLMKAHITASNKEAYNLLNSNIQDLSDKLGDQQIKIQSFAVDINNGNDHFNNESASQNNQQNKGSRNRLISAIDDEDDSNISESEILDIRNLNMFA